MTVILNNDILKTQTTGNGYLLGVIMNKRDVQFGRLLAIASILYDKIENNGSSKMLFKYGERFKKCPLDTFAKIHEEIMENSYKFDETHYTLLDMFQEIFWNMNFEDFNNEPLENNYILHYYKERNKWANSIMDTKTASELWGLSPERIKHLCNEGKIEAVKVGNSWAINRNQPNPKKYKKDDI